MLINQKPTGTTCSIPIGLAWGGSLSLAVTLAGTAVAAWMIERGNIMPENTGYAAIIILIMSAYCGAKLAYRKIRRRKVLVCFLSGVVYYGILLTITALFFGSQYNGAGETALMVICGTTLEILMQKPQKTRALQRKFQIRNG